MNSKHFMMAVILIILCARLHAQNVELPPNDYTVLNTRKYRFIVETSRQKIQKILGKLSAYRHHTRDKQLAVIITQLADFPYLDGGIGEGDWQSRSWVYKPGALHTQQNP